METVEIPNNSRRLERTADHFVEQSSTSENLIESIRNAVSNASSSEPISDGNDGSNRNNGNDSIVHESIGLPIFVEDDCISSDESSCSNDVSGNEDRIRLLFSSTMKEMENRRLFRYRSKEISDLKPWSNIESFLKKQEMDLSRKRLESETKDGRLL